jgi:voltage-gated potassium channel
MREPTAMDDSRVPLQPSSRLDRRARAAVANRRAFPYVALVTAVVGFGIGVTVKLVAPEDFQSYEDGIWWAIVTLGTVGYGDIVPTTTWGRILGAFVIVIGVTFLSFLTATVTSLFVSNEQASKDAQRDALQKADWDAVIAELRQIDERLTAIETKLR